MYFATPNEYQVGGYEATLTLWGIDTAEKIRAACHYTAHKISPPRLRNKERYQFKSPRSIQQDLEFAAKLSPDLD